MSDETKVNVAAAMLSPINKLEGLSQLFDCAADSERLDRLDLSGTIGISALLHSISSEILSISNDLDGQIKEFAS